METFHLITHKNMICHLKIQKNPVINHQKGFLPKKLFWSEILFNINQNFLQAHKRTRFTIYKIFAMDNQAGLLDSVVLDKNFKLNPSGPSSILNHTPRSHDMADQ